MTPNAKSISTFLSSPETLQKIYRVTRVTTEVKFRLPDWQDVAHTTILRAMDRADSFKGATEEQFLAWYVAILKNSLIDKTRKRGKEPVLVGDELLSTLGAPPDVANDGEDERKALVEQLLTSLPPRQQTVITLRYLFNCTTAEVAKLLRISEGAVRTAQFKAIQTLKAATSEGSD